MKGFWWILGKILVPKSTPKSMLSSKGVFFKKMFSLKENHTFWRSSGSKLGGKIDLKLDAETERLENSILIDFSSIWEPSWLSKTEPRRSKIDVEIVSKIDEFLKAFWNTIFRPRDAKTANAVRQCARPGGRRSSHGKDPPAHLRWCDGRVGRL